MVELMQASAQWWKRPSDERFTSLPQMLSKLTPVRERAAEMKKPVKELQIEPTTRHRIAVRVPGYSDLYEPTNWSFGQLTQLGKTPSDYVRELGRRGASELAADCVNFGLKFMRAQDDVGLLLDGKGGDLEVGELRAATGPSYGRIWNVDVIRALIDLFGDGVSGDFRVPGEFGKAVTVDTQNTTLYASDRDMFVFLADETNRVEIPNRRNGKIGSLARGFFAWNSEVGSKTMGLATFLFDYACYNRIVWGAEQFAEVSIRHSAGAPERWLGELKPALVSYVNAPESNIGDAVKAAQAAKIETDVAEFMATRFGKQKAASMLSIHEIEEGRPVETLWDAATAATAFARTIDHQDNRVDVERKAGEILKLAA